MKNTKKYMLTIGLCVKNCEATVGKAVEGILDQDFPHELMEIIVVDGDSKDKTLTIIKKHLSKTDMPVRIFSDQGKGLGTARSIVADNASSKYVLQLDGDIVLPRDYLREQVKFMDNNQDVGMTRGKWCMRKGGSLVAVLESMRELRVEFVDPRTKTPSFLPGNAASIYRAEALKQIGGWDQNISAGEDIDISTRLKAAGWLLSINQQVYHSFRQTWKDLWDEYSWWGYGNHQLSHKHRHLIELWRRLPPIAFVSGILQSFDAYSTTRRKAAFLLPFHNTFKMTGWWVGFAKSHIDGKGHSKR